MIIEVNNKQVIRVDLTTGGTLVGEGLYTPAQGITISGTQIENNAKNTNSWIATSGFDLNSDGEEVYGRIDQVFHRDAPNIKVCFFSFFLFFFEKIIILIFFEKGVRISSGTPIVADKSFVVTPLGILVGDMPSSFITKNTGKADVLVSGSTYIQNEVEGSQQCSDLPIEDFDLRTDVDIQYQLLKLNVIACDSPNSLKNATLIDTTTHPDFLGCQVCFIFHSNQFLPFSHSKK